MDEYFVGALAFLAVVVPTVLYCMSDRSVKIAKPAKGAAERQLPFMLQLAEPFANLMDKVGMGDFFYSLSPAKAAGGKSNIQGIRRIGIFMIFARFL